MGQPYTYGDARPVVAPVQTAQAVEVGDLVGLSSGNVVRAEDQVWDTSLAVTQKAFVAAFLGVSAQRKVANVAKPYGNGVDNEMRIDTGGVHEFNCASATFKVGDLVGPAKQSGNALESQKVVAVADEDLAIGRVHRATASATTVLVEVLSAKKPAARGVTIDDPEALVTLTDNSGGAAADGTIGAVTAPTTLVDSTGGTPATTFAAITAPGANATTSLSADMTAVKNALSQVVVSQNADRTAIIALTDAVKELSTAVNSIFTILKNKGIMASS